MENKDLEKMFNIRLTKRCCENCYFNQEGICKFNNELIKESKECDYYIDKKMVLEQMINNAMEIKKIKNIIENPDFQKKMDVFIEKNQELKEPKSLEEHAKKLEENFKELFDGVNIFGKAKEEIIEMLKEFALPLITMYIDDEGKTHYVDYNVYVNFCKKNGLQPIVTEEKFYLVRKLYENE